MTRKQKRMLWRIGIAALLYIAGWVLPIPETLRFWAFLAPYMVVGWDVLWSALGNIRRGQVFDEQFLMTVATLGAFAIAEYPEATAVMLFYQIGEWFQSIAVGKSRRSIAQLMDIRPDHAVVLRDGREVTLSPEEVEPGEVVLVRPGEKIALDGVILEGCTTVSSAALTGESLPVDKCPGDVLYSGSVNMTGVLRMQVTRPYAEGTVARILELVENATQKKASIEKFITRFARWYTPCVVLGAALLSVLPPLFFGEDWGMWVHRGLIFLVMSCPCALVISVPLSFFGGIGGASRRGILVKGANDLEVLAQVDTVVLDKTGTLTEGKFTVKAICSDVMSKEALLETAALAECYANHPIAQSILEAYGKDVDKTRVGHVENMPGMGVRAMIDGKLCFVGNTSLMKQAGAKWSGSSSGGSIVHLSEENRYLGYIVIGDTIKAQAAEVLRKLNALGIKKTVMLTGDSQEIAREVGAAVGVDEVYGQLLPAQKVERVEQLLEQGCKVAFVGDGINDAPVLSRANVGVAMGALGSDAAIEAADVVLMDDHLMKLPVSIAIARKTVAIVRQNVVLALGVKAVILLLGAAGLSNLWMAVFGDVGVMILAILNAMRTLRASEP